MTVIYLHQYFNTPGMSGGTRSYEFARRLVMAGHAVHMVTTCRETPAPAPIGAWYATEEAGIRVHWLVNPYSNRMSYAARMRSFLRYALCSARKAATLQGDLIFATSTPLTVAMPALYARWRRRIPMVFEVRDLWPAVPIALGALRHPVACRAARWLERRAYHGSAHVIALSPAMAAGVARCGVPAGRISLIPNSCDVEAFTVPDAAGAAIRAQLALAPGQPLVVYAGTFGRVNGVGYLVALAEHMRHLHPQVRFLLVGDGLERPAILAQAQAAQLLDRNLWIWDPVEKSRMPAILAAATVSVSTVIPVPALWENSANKFFDALAAGRPIAINHEGWQAELIRRQGCGIVLPPDDPRQGALQLGAFLQDPAVARKAGYAARQLAAQFDRDRQYQDFERILLSAAGGPDACRSGVQPKANGGCT